MAFCEKCGGVISENMKFCDKCGSPISNESVPTSSQTQEVEENISSAEESVQVNQNPIQTEYFEEAQEETADKRKVDKIQFNLMGYFDNFLESLPPVVTRPGSKIMYLGGMGSLFLLSLVYVVCFFVFMADIAFVVGCRALPDVSISMFNISPGKTGASSIWMIVYFAVNLFPLTLALLAFFKPSKKYLAIIASVACLVMTLVSLIAWGSCNAEDFISAVGIYPTLNTWGTFAWYCLVDCLSEAWYLKIPLALISGFAFGIDHIINNAKK